jgi:hypothetical protein
MTRVSNAKAGISNEMPNEISEIHNDSSCRRASIRTLPINRGVSSVSSRSESRFWFDSSPTPFLRSLTCGTIERCRQAGRLKRPDRQLVGDKRTSSIILKTTNGISNISARHPRIFFEAIHARKGRHATLSDD